MFYYINPDDIKINTNVTDETIFLEGDLATLNSSHTYKCYSYKKENSTIIIKVSYYKLPIFSAKTSEFTISIKEKNVNKIILTNGIINKIIYSNN